MKLFAASIIAACAVAAQTKTPAARPPSTPAFSSFTRDFIIHDAPKIALVHANVIDGTGADARSNQTLLISNGKIETITGDGAAGIDRDTRVIDLSGKSVLPGIVGMHDHLFYTAKIPDRRPLDGGITEVDGPGLLVAEVAFSAPRLYLASGLTTIRTTGSVEPYADIRVKKRIDEGQMPGPKVHLTAPYLEGSPTDFAQMHELKGPQDARRFVEYWADQGFTSFKAYMHIKRADLSAAIQAAHKRGLKVTGHLCSIGFREAAALGIDNLEHGFLVDSEFVPNQPDVCPERKIVEASLEKLDPDGDEAKRTIQELVQRKVAITSTLPVFELTVPGRPVLEVRGLEVLLPEARNSFLLRKAISLDRATPTALALFKKEMQLELMFVRAGGLLLNGSDPTGAGGAVPGFADLRGVELLVEAGFTPLEAIKVSTLNGAVFLGESARIGSIAKGKQADLMVVRGDPSKNIADIQNVEVVFKDGVGYSSAKLVDSVRGLVGLR